MESDPQPRPPEAKEVGPADVKRFTSSIDRLVEGSPEATNGIREAYFSATGSRDSTDTISVGRQDREDGGKVYVATRIEEQNEPVGNEWHNLETVYVLGSDGRLKHEFHDLALDTETEDPLDHDRHPEALKHEALPGSERVINDMYFNQVADEIEQDSAVDPESFKHVLSVLEAKAESIRTQGNNN